MLRINLRWFGNGPYAVDNLLAGKSTVELLGLALGVAYRLLRDQGAGEGTGPVEGIVRARDGFTVRVRTPGMGVLPDPQTGQLNGIVVGTTAGHRPASDN